MKTITIETIRSWKPCYNPSRYFTEDWSGTVIDILKDDRISWGDRLWASMRTELVSEKLVRLFAVWCARQVQHLMTDKRSLDVLDVAERFANGEATDQELAAAWDAAGDAAGDAARDAAWDAARAAAQDAAWDAAWAAAWAAARAAARDAAWDAAGAAAWDAAGDAAGDAARAAAWDAARAAAQDAQKKKLIEMIEAENK